MADPGAARDAAHQILGQPQFRQPPQPIEDRVRHWIGQQLVKLVDAALSGHITVIGAVVLAAVVATVVWLVARTARHGRDPVAAGLVVSDSRRSPEVWLEEAETCERRGAWREALRARYRALVAELARRGLVEEIPGRTTGEYRAEVRTAVPAAAEDFGGATDLFELTVYGDQPAGREDAQRVRRLADQVLERAR